MVIVTEKKGDYINKFGFQKFTLFSKYGIVISLGMYDFGGLVEKMGIFAGGQTFITERLEHFLYKYGEVANVYVAAFDGSGAMLADFACSKEERAKIDKIFTTEEKKEIFQRITESGLEDQIVEDAGYPTIKIAASAIKQKGKTQMVWVFLGQIKEEMEQNRATEEASASEIITFERQTTAALFFWAIDVLRDIGLECIQAQHSIAEWEAANRRSKNSENEMTGNMRRMEIIMELLQYMDSDKTIEYIMQEFLQLTAPYLKADVANIISKEDKVNFLAQWGEENASLKALLESGRMELPSGKKPTILSYDSPALRNMKENENLPFHAVALIPIEISNQTVVYVCYYDSCRERVWKLEEVQFMKDTVRILQNIFEKRVHENSIASSYASLEEILETIGCAVIVFDADSHRIQFINQKSKLMFPEDSIDMKFLEDIRQILLREKSYEFCDRKREKWYEAHRNEVRWVDGKSHIMYSIFDITDKKQYQQKIEQQAYTDFLTGLFNRLCCERDLARTVDEAKKYGETGALLYLDLDDFKNINDGLGHRYGDTLLKNISEEFRRVRGIEDTSYRMGGDEFVIIISPSWYGEVDRIVEEIKEIFAKPWALRDENYYCTMSMGIVTFLEEGDSVADLIQKADIAMYEAKKSGKNRVAKFDRETLEESNKRLDMEKNMRDASTNGYHEFQVYYQPIVDIQKEGTPCVGAEALIRWNSASMGFISPDDFIPLAEYLGLINPIGNHVLRQACIACKEWNENGHPEFKVNVNLSVIQLLQNNIVEIVEDTLAEVGLSPTNLTLEVTESLAINDMERMKEIMRRIRMLGVRIALDDFGTGYSSLNHIREIPLDVIKVDRSFVRELVEDEYSQAFVKMVSELAGTLGVSICVEGIEEREQYKVLENMKVRMVQGYYFDRPMPKSEFWEKYIVSNVKTEEKKAGTRRKK